MPPPPWQGLALWVLLPVSAIAVLLWVAFGVDALTTGPVVAAVIVAAVLCLLVASVRYNRATISDGKLHLVAGLLFRRHVPLADIDFDRIEIIYEPRSVRQWLGIRVLGASFPGFYAGWFRHRGRWVFALALSAAPALHLPVRGRADIVIAVASPQDALAKLRNSAGA
ncbi:hypothetical protein GYB61_02865 [bacterium]|nr:hypothetical protein [bacterium]